MQTAPPKDAPERGGLAAVEDAAADLLRPFLEKPVPERSVRRAVRFASLSGSDIILDKRALLLGAVSVGVEESDNYDLSRSGAHPDLPYILQGEEFRAAWFADWVRRRSPMLPALLEEIDRETIIVPAFAEGARIDVSQIEPLFDRARQIAMQTEVISTIDFRHLLFALLEQPGAEWDFLQERPSTTEMRKLFEDMLGWVEKGGFGSGDAWRSLLPKEWESAAAQTADDRYRTQTDDPAKVDALERSPFAEVLATRIIEARQILRNRSPDEGRAFMVHLHGPWGSGKSSMLNLIQQELERDRPGEKPSLVVWFDAWKHQRMRPPWWTLLVAMYKTALPRLYRIGEKRWLNPQHWALRRIWWRWRLRADWVPILLVALLLGGLGFAIVRGMPLGAFDLPLKIFAALVTAGAGIYTYARLVLFGSSKAAQTYADLTTDPYGPIVELFGKMVDKIDLPLVVFIDDLDRCDSDYVVELLEGIQTLFRHAPVTYVVAADRKWICSSFEKKYRDFCLTIGDPCRPLGYLFLEKMFQISAGMPKLSSDLQARYLTGLLTPGDPEPTLPDEETARRARERVKGLTDEASLQQVIDETRSASIAEQQAVRAAAAVQITSAEAARQTEHRLEKFADLLEPNPRSMKRLVNAVGMAQARGFLEGRVATPEARARWAMLSIRWPLFADFIADNPEEIGRWTLRNGEQDAIAAEPDPAWPSAIQQLYGNRTVMTVIGGPDDEGHLTPESLRLLLT